MAEVYEDVMGIMLPTLGAERQRDVLALPADLAGQRKGAAGADGPRRRQGRDRHVYRARDGRGNHPAGHRRFACKVQWKPDWALRWYALQVDYEMYGKDLIDSAKIAARI